MAVNIKNEDVEALLDEVVRITGESKTEAIRKALAERHQRLILHAVAPRNEARLLAFLEDEVWSQIPPELLNKPLSKEEEEAILGYGDWGV
jgi:antitoxin VapB